MRSDRRSLSLALTLVAAAALAVACGTRAPETRAPTPPPQATPAAAPAATGPAIRILVTHPSKVVLERFATLRELGLLPAGNLEVVGVVHAGEWEDYGPAQAFADEQGAWLRIERITCALSPETLFDVNACTPVFERLLATSAGIVFTGGPDLPPHLYGEKTQLTTAIAAPRRHEYELSWLFHLLGRGEPVGPIPLLAQRPELPVLAICLGMQTMNVATGGAMIQDIPSEVYGVSTFEDGLAQPADEVHRSFHFLLDPSPGVARGSVHPIRLAAGSRLRRAIPGGGEVAYVLSAHHQAVEQVGTGLRVVATSMDGKVVEAMEHELFANVLGVQFHPDYLELWRPEIEYAETAAAPVRNLATAAMEAHPESRELNREIWLEFSRLATRAASSAAE